MFVRSCIFPQVGPNYYKLSGLLALLAGLSWLAGLEGATFIQELLILQSKEKKQKPPFGTFKPVTSMYLMLESKGVEDEYSQLMGAVINPILCTFLDRVENTVSQNSSCIYSRLPTELE